MKPLEMHLRRESNGFSWQTEVLLEILELNYALTIMEWIELGIYYKVGSMATLHKCIDQLRESNLIEELESDDGRKRLFGITSQGRNYLGK